MILHKHRAQKPHSFLHYYWPEPDLWGRHQHSWEALSLPSVSGLRVEAEAAQLDD